MSAPEKFWTVEPRNHSDPEDVHAAELAERLLNAQGADFYRAAFREAARMSVYDMSPARRRAHAEAFARRWLDEHKP